MNRRLFMGLLTGLAAIPAAVRAVVAPKCAPAAQLPPIQEIPGYHTEWVKPREAMSQMTRPDPLFATTDMAAYPDRDYCETVVCSRDPLTKQITIHDYFEYSHEAVVECGLYHLEWVSIECVRRALRYGKVYIQSRMHREDVQGHVLAQDTTHWKRLELRR